MIKHKIANGIIYLYMKKMGYFGWTSYWSTIYYIDKLAFNNNRLRKHELEHVRQMKELGKFKFTLEYLWQAYTVGYKNNKFEIMARAAENK